MGLETCIFLLNLILARGVANVIGLSNKSGADIFLVLKNTADLQARRLDISPAFTRRFKSEMLGRDAG